jgi:DNA-binding PadR family transcriptional regulator
MSRDFWKTHEARRRAFGWPPPMPHERGHRGRGRGRDRMRGSAGRVSVRDALLALLKERPMHGYEMIQELEQRTGGVWRPSPGSVYPTLQLLEDEGLIVSEESEGRKRFTLTDRGRTEADRSGDDDTAPWDRFGEDEMTAARDIRDAIGGIMQALRQVGFAGTDEQRTRALQVLNETRRKLYAILAEED